MAGSRSLVGGADDRTDQYALHAAPSQKNGHVTLPIADPELTALARAGAAERFAMTV